jgi:hypothetical protein
VKEDKKILKKNIISSLVFTILVIIVFYFIFKKNNFYKVLTIFQNSNKLYLVIAVLCMACFSLCEAINLRQTLNFFDEKISFRKAYKYALAGFFVSSITPSSSGGDPMQLYLMSKDKISVSHSALTLLVKLLAFQFVTITLAFLGFITSYDIFSHALGNIKYIIFLGVFLNFLMFSLYFLIIFFKSVIIFLVELFSKLLDKIHYKKRTQLIKKIYMYVDEYSMASTYLIKNKKFLLRVILVTYIQMLLSYSVSYFVYLSLGFTKYSILTFISIQSILFISVSSLPFPGAVGISEATFMHLYKSLFPKDILGSAMVITRFINFYIYVLYSGITMLILIVKDNLSKKK